MTYDNKSQTQQQQQRIKGLSNYSCTLFNACTSYIVVCKNNGNIQKQPVCSKNSVDSFQEGTCAFVVGLVVQLWAVHLVVMVVLHLSPPPVEL